MPDDPDRSRAWADRPWATAPRRSRRRAASTAADSPSGVSPDSLGSSRRRMDLDDRVIYSTRVAITSVGAHDARPHDGGADLQRARADRGARARRLRRVLAARRSSLEMVIVDDNSPDGTGAVADELARNAARSGSFTATGKLGLGTAVMEGFQVASARSRRRHGRGLQPSTGARPEAARDAARTRAPTSSSPAVTSRAAAPPNWPFKRRLLSQVACALARPLSPIRDAASGFFLIRRDIASSIAIKAADSRSAWSWWCAAAPSRLVEIPYRFDDREQGESKMSLREAAGYLVQLKDLYSVRWRSRSSGPVEYHREPAQPRNPADRLTKRSLTKMLFTSFFVLSLSLSSGPSNSTSATGQGAPVSQRPAPSATVSEGTDLTNGWAMLTEGKADQAVARADRVLSSNPRSVAAFVLGVEAELLRNASTAALLRYQRWIGARMYEEPSALRRIASGVLRELSASKEAAPTRLEALRALAEDGDVQAAAALRQGVKAAHLPEARVLARMGDEAAVKVLIDDLKQTAGRSMAGIEALGASGSSLAVAALTEQLTHGPPEIRAAAAESLGKLGSKYSTASRIKPLLNDSTTDVRYKAAAALFALGDMTGLKILQDLAAQESPAGRLMAAQAMAAQPGAEWQQLVRHSCRRRNRKSGSAPPGCCCPTSRRLPGPSSRRV